MDRVSPGDVRLNIPQAAWMREYASYEVSIQTRSYDEVFTGKTIGDAIRKAADGMVKPIVEGDHDPIVPSWYRVSRTSIAEPRTARSPTRTGLPRGRAP